MPSEELGASSTPEQVDDAMAQDRKESLGAMAPAAAEPLEAEKVNRLAATVKTAIDKLGGGQVQAPEVERVSGELQQLPPPLYTSLTTLDMFFRQAAGAGLPGAEKYQMDVESIATTNNGLDEGLATVSEIASDTELHRAVQQAAGPAPKKEAKPEPEKKEPEKSDKGFDNIV